MVLSCSCASTLYQDGDPGLLGLQVLPRVSCGVGLAVQCMLLLLVVVVCEGARPSGKLCLANRVARLCLVTRLRALD